MLALAFTYCTLCGQWVGHWAGCPKARCTTCRGEQVVERTASPGEVDHGCELGVAYDPCPDCRSTPPPDPLSAGVLTCLSIVEP